MGQRVNCVASRVQSPKVKRRAKDQVVKKNRFYIFSPSFIGMAFLGQDGCLAILH